MVQQSLVAVLYATHAKELRPAVLRLLDSLVVHFTLISLSLYTPSSSSSSSSSSSELANNQQQDSDGSSSTGSSSSSSSSSSSHALRCSTSLDFMLIVDCLYDVLCNDDCEYWPCVQRAIMVMIETSEVVSYNHNTAHSISSSSSIYRPNLVNLALFDYLAEKVGQLCYERSWYAKKAGCFVIRLLSKRMPFVWLLANCYAFIRSLMFILVAVTGEVKSYLF